MSPESHWCMGTREGNSGICAPRCPQSGLLAMGRTFFLLKLKWLLNNFGSSFWPQSGTTQGPPAPTQGCVQGEKETRQSLRYKFLLNAKIRFSHSGQFGKERSLKRKWEVSCQFNMKRLSHSLEKNKSDGTNLPHPMVVKRSYPLCCKERRTFPITRINLKPPHLSPQW